MPETIEAAQKLGDGGLSDGIDRLFAQLPIFERVVARLQEEAQGLPVTESADSLLADLALLLNLTKS